MCFLLKSITTGEGQFGKVYSAVNLDTGDLMAVKQVYNFFLKNNSAVDD